MPGAAACRPTVGAGRALGPAPVGLSARCADRLVRSVAGLLLLLAAGCAGQPPVAPGTPTPPAVLAESAESCFGVTARLALLHGAGDSSPVTPAARAVRGVRWRLVVDGPPEMLAAGGVTASLDAFTIRGEQADRLDLALLRWPGSPGPLSARGPVRVPEVHGAIRDGDQARLLAYIRTPRGEFGVRGIVFGLRAHPDGPGAVAPAALPPAGCPPP